MLRLARQAGRLTGLTRQFAAAPATAEKFDFADLEELATTDDTSRQLDRLKSTFREMDNAAKTKKQTPKIDFAAQFKDLDPDVAKAFQTAQDGLKFPDYDFAADLKEIDELFDPLIQQADEMGQQASKRLAEIKNEMKALDDERARISRSTIDEELAADPEMAKKIDKEIIEANYMIT